MAGLHPQHFEASAVWTRMAHPRKERPFPRDWLFRKMSEVISLREKVAQAELAANVGRPSDQRDQIARPEK
jgi:hypothetical protein